MAIIGIGMANLANERKKSPQVDVEWKVHCWLLLSLGGVTGQSRVREVLGIYCESSLFGVSIQCLDNCTARSWGRRRLQRRFGAGRSVLFLPGSWRLWVPSIVSFQCPLSWVATSKRLGLGNDGLCDFHLSPQSPFDHVPTTGSVRLKAGRGSRLELPLSATELELVEAQRFHSDLRTAPNCEPAFSGSAHLTGSPRDLAWDGEIGSLHSSQWLPGQGPAATRGAFQGRIIAFDCSAAGGGIGASSR